MSASVHVLLMYMIWLVVHCIVTMTCSFALCATAQLPASRETNTSAIFSQQRQMDNCKIFLRMYLWHVRVLEAAAEQAAAQFGSMYIKMQQDEQVYRLLLA